MKLKYYSGAQVMSIIEKLPSKEYFEMLISFSEEPSADVAQVVRCKDCKYCEWYIKASYNNGIEVESHECRKYKMAVTRDWFCADGERRDNG